MTLGVCHLDAERPGASFRRWVDISTTYFDGAPLVAMRGTFVENRRKNAKWSIMPLWVKVYQRLHRSSSAEAHSKAPTSAHKTTSHMGIKIRIVCVLQDETRKVRYKNTSMSFAFRAAESLVNRYAEIRMRLIPMRFFKGYKIASETCSPHDCRELLQRSETRRSYVFVDFWISQGFQFTQTQSMENRDNHQPMSNFKGYKTASET